MSDAYSWSPDVPPAHEHAWTRAYRRGARVAHIRELIHIAHPGAPASWDRAVTWYGTGSQGEYDRAAAMPLCARCFVVRINYDGEGG